MSDLICAELFWRHPINFSEPFRKGHTREKVAGPAVWNLGNWKGFGHDKSSICVSDRCNPRCHCLGDIITCSSVAGWLGPRSRRWINCWRGDRWHSVQRVRLWSGLRLLWWTRVRLLRRTKVRLLWRLRPCLRRIRPSLLRLRSRILWPSVLWGLVIAQARPLKSPEQKGRRCLRPFLCPSWVR